MDEAIVPFVWMVNTGYRINATTRAMKCLQTLGITNLSFSVAGRDVLYIFGFCSLMQKQPLRELMLKSYLSYPGIGEIDGVGFDE